MTRHIITLPQTPLNSAQKVYQGLIPPEFDRIMVEYPDTVTEVYKYYLWDVTSSGYVLKGTIEAVYTDATKDNLSVVTRLSI
jgi:hypothetical protein